MGIRGYLSLFSKLTIVMVLGTLLTVPMICILPISFFGWVYQKLAHSIAWSHHDLASKYVGTGIVPTLKSDHWGRLLIRLPVFMTSDQWDRK